MSHYQAPSLRRKLHLDQKKHNLLYSWTLWYHSPESNNWDVDSYQKIFTINSIEDFWACYESIKESYLSVGMFFLMRDNILPTWEDPHNINGGCWSFKVSRKDTYMSWLELSISLLGNCLCKDQTNTKLLTGISISPKKGFCIIKIWNCDQSYSDPLLLTSIPGLILEESIFKSFSPSPKE